MSSSRAKHDDTTEGRQTRRHARFALRDGLMAVSRVKRLRTCGRRRVDGSRLVEGVVVDGVAHLRNVALCGSIHACPVCAPRIRSARAVEIEQGLALWLAGGGGCEFVTCTLPHDEGDRLKPLLAAVTESWSAVISGRAWVGVPDVMTWRDADGVKHRRVVGRIGGLRNELGIEGSIRALEVTCGCNGWHPHVHVLMLTGSPLDAGRRALLLSHVAGVWGRNVQAHGYRSPDVAHGVTVSSVTTAADVARYTAKVDDEGVSRAVGNEMARHDLKAGRRKGRGPFLLLASAVLDGDADDLDLWHEYEHAITGQRAIAWSKGLKDRLRVAEVTDAEIVEAPIGGEAVRVLTEQQWRAVCAKPGAIGALHRALEDGPVATEIMLSEALFWWWDRLDRYRLTG